MQPLRPDLLPTMTVTVNGKELKALIDTGSDQTLVNRKFVAPSLVRSFNNLSICCVHGEERMVPTADLYIGVEGQTYLLEVGVADNLPYPVVLGHDVPVLLDLVQPSQQCHVVVKSAMAKWPEELMETVNIAVLRGRLTDEWPETKKISTPNETSKVCNVYAI